MIRSTISFLTDRNTQSRSSSPPVACAGSSKDQCSPLVSLTGAGVRDPKDEPKLIDKIIGSLLKFVQRDLLEDAIGQARVIQESDLDWVIVRAPVLNEGEKKGEYRVGYVGKESGSRLSRADLADFMLKQTTDDTYLHQAPMVSY